MSISKDQVQYIASLSRLRLTNQEASQFTEQLNQILLFAEKLNELNTENTEPTNHVLSIKNVLREDIVLPMCSREKALSNAPSQKDGMFLVPAVFED